VFTIRVKWPPKPDPVKRRPPTARRFYLAELAVPLGYIFVTSHALTNVANALPGAGHRRYPPRRFVSSPSAAPAAPLRSAPGCHPFHLNLDQPHRLAHILPSNRPGADDDVQHGPRPSRLPPCAVHARVPRTTSLPSSRLLCPLSTNASCGAFIGLEPRRRQ
jgi:hypothetical protein